MGIRQKLFEHLVKPKSFKEGDWEGGVGGSGKAHLWIIYLGQMNHLALESCKKGLSFYSPKSSMKTTNSGSCYYSMLEKPVDQKKKSTA